MISVGGTCASSQCTASETPGCLLEVQIAVVCISAAELDLGGGSKGVWCLSAKPQFLSLNTLTRASVSLTLHWGMGVRSEDIISDLRRCSHRVYTSDQWCGKLCKSIFRNFTLKLLAINYFLFLCNSPPKRGCGKLAWQLRELVIPAEKQCSMPSTLIWWFKTDMQMVHVYTCNQNMYIQK